MRSFPNQLPISIESVFERFICPARAAQERAIADAKIEEMAKDGRLMTNAEALRAIASAVEAMHAAKRCREVMPFIEARRNSMSKEEFDKAQCWDHKCEWDAVLCLQPFPGKANEKNTFDVMFMALGEVADDAESAARVALEAAGFVVVDSGTAIPVEKTGFTWEMKI